MLFVKLHAMQRESNITVRIMFYTSASPFGLYVIPYEIRWWNCSFYSLKIYMEVDYEGEIYWGYSGESLFLRYQYHLHNLSCYRAPNFSAIFSEHNSPSGDTSTVDKFHQALLSIKIRIPFLYENCRNVKSLERSNLFFLSIV